MAKQNRYLAKAALYLGADVNNQDFSTTPLIWIVFDNNPELIELLLKNKADIDKKDILGYTALMRATELKYNNIIKLLLDTGADPFIKFGYDNVPTNRKVGTTVLDQKYNPVISEFMRPKILPILNNEEFSPLPKNLAQLTAEFTY